MKIAFVSNNGQTISRHFGRARNFIVISVADEGITDRKTIPKSSQCNAQSRQRRQHGHASETRGRGFGPHAGAAHQKLFTLITDCDMVVSRGMGRGAWTGLQQRGIDPIITDIVEIDEAVQAILDNTMVNHTEKLH